MAVGQQGQLAQGQDWFVGCRRPSRGDRREEASKETYTSWLGFQNGSLIGKWGTTGEVLSLGAHTPTSQCGAGDGGGDMPSCRCRSASWAACQHISSSVHSP